MQPSDQAVDSLRTISAEEFAKSIRDHQIQDFSRCLIEGDVDLNAIDYPHKLVIEDSLFRGRFDVGGAHFAKSVDLSRCTFEQGVDFSGTRVDGHLVLHSAVIQAGAVEGASAKFELVRIDGNLVVSRMQSDLGLDLRNIKITGDVGLSGARVKGDLFLQAPRSGSGLFCRPEGGQPTEIGGKAWLVGAKVTGAVAFSGAQVTGDLYLRAPRLGRPVLPAQGRPAH